MSMNAHPDDPGPVVLTGERVHLASVTPDCAQFLYHLATSTHTGYRWRYRGSVPPYDAFIQQINADILSQFIVRERSDGTLIGHVVAYAADLRNRFTFVANVMDGSRIGGRYGAEAQVLFIEYLFKVWDFRKIYVEIPEFTFDGVKQHLGSRLFSIEGRLTAHTYYAGRYWDQYILAVTRESWERGIASVWAETWHSIHGI